MRLLVQDKPAAYQEQIPRVTDALARTERIDRAVGPQKRLRGDVSCGLRVLQLLARVTLHARVVTLEQGDVLAALASLHTSYDLFVGQIHVGRAEPLSRV